MTSAVSVYVIIIRTLICIKWFAVQYVYCHGNISLRGGQMHDMLVINAQWVQPKAGSPLRMFIYK